MVELPKDQVDTVYVYTCVYRLHHDDNVLEVLKTAMDLNYLQDRTRGSSLGVAHEKNEVNLCRTVALASLSAVKLKAILNEFLITAVETNMQLKHAKSAW